MLTKPFNLAGFALKTSAQKRLNKIFNDGQGHQDHEDLEINAVKCLSRMVVKPA